MLDRERRLTNVVKPNLKWYRSENDANKNNARVMYLFSMSLAWMNFERLLHALRLRGLGIFSNNVVKVSKLQMLTFRFETIRRFSYKIDG